jgi:hypothetical protein
MAVLGAEINHVPSLDLDDKPIAESVQKMNRDGADRAKVRQRRHPIDEIPLTRGGQTPDPQPEKGCKQYDVSEKREKDDV